MEVALLVFCAGVFHALIGVEEVVADLRAEADLGLQLILGCFDRLVAVGLRSV